MPLLDHFRAPTRKTCPWRSFQGMWASSLVAVLNDALPRDRYLAQMNYRLGSQVEADVAELESLPAAGAGNGPGGVATLAYAPPAVSVTMPAKYPDEVGLTVRDVEDDYRVVGVVELVSPANKKEVGERRSFCGKCSTYLQKGIGLVILDVVTERGANLHDELVRFLALSEDYLYPAEAPTSVTSYRPTRRADQNLIDVWLRPLAVGEQLPIVPLPLKGAGVVPLDLETAYADALRRSGL
jgi:hypothetical protein